MEYSQLSHKELISKLKKLEDQYLEFEETYTSTFEISGKKKAIDELFIDEEFNTRIINSLPGVFYLYAVEDGKTRLIKWNKNHETITGYSTEELKNMSSLDFFEKKDQASILTAINEVLEDGTAQIESKFITKNGTKIPYYFEAFRFVDNGKDYFLGFGLDISKRLKTEELLKKSEEKYSALVENSNDGIIVHRDGIVIFANQLIKKELGFEVDEVLGKKMIDFIAPDSRELVLQSGAARLAGKKVPQIYQINLIGKEGVDLPVEVNTSIVNYEGEEAFLVFIRNISERKNIEEKLQKSEERFRLAMRGANEGLWDWDVVNNTVYFSPQYKKMLGYEDDEIKNESESWENLLHKDDLEVAKQSVDTFLKEGKENFEAEFRMKHKNGSHRNILSKAYCIRSASGDPIRIIGTHIDITELRLAEQELHRSEKKIKGLLNANLDKAMLLDPDYRIIAINDAMASVFNKLPQELLNMVSLDLLPKTLATGRKKMADEAINTRSPVRFTDERDGRWYDNSIYPLFDENKNLSEVAIYAHDITELKKAESTLVETYDIINSSPLVIFQWGSDYSWDTLSVTENVINLLGYSSSEFISGKISYKDVIHKDDFDRITSEVTTHYNSNSDQLLIQEYRVITKEGALKWVRDFPRVVRDKKGNVSHYNGVMYDITIQKKVKEDLINSEQFLLQSQKVANVGSYTYNLNRETWKSSVTHDDIFGIDDSYVKDYEGWLNLIHPEDKKEVVEYYANEDLIKLGKLEKEYRIIKINNQEERWVRDKGEVILNQDKRPLKVIGTILDITESKHAELDLQNAFAEVSKLKKQLERENVYLKEQISFAYNFEDMVYSSVGFSDVLTEVEQVANTDATVLILGESGTGKELIASALHNLSKRKEKGFIKVNCAAIPSELIESELFGHIKGSFTGAINDRIGKFELADGGTLFLDEIGEMPLKLQPKLLRAIQEGEIEPIGSSEIRKLDVRIVAATNRDLKKEAEEKRFREDLYFRLNVFPITIPPLRERIDDIPILIDHFVTKFCKKYGKSITHISDNTLQQLKSYTWPGNVRELENLIERAVIINNDEHLKFKEFESSDQSSPIKQNNMNLDEVTRNHIIRILNETNWKISGKDGAAELLDVKPSTLRDRMKKLGIKRSSSK